MKVSMFLITVILAAAPGLLTAQDARKVPANLAWVITGGHWSADSMDGVSRLLVFSGGSDHIVSEFHLQWVVEGGGTDTARIVRSVAITEINGVWASARMPTVSAYELETAYTIELMDTHQYPIPRRRCTVLIKTLGSYSLSCRDL